MIFVSLSDEVKTALSIALESAHETKENINAIVLAMSGCNTPADSALMESWGSQICPNAKVCRAFNDSIGALASGTRGTLDGIVLICGTGTICFGCTMLDDGKLLQRTCCGHGALVDLGSGFSMGQSVLRAAFDAEDGLVDTVLRQAVLDRQIWSSMAEAYPFLYGEGKSEWSKVAAFARIAIDNAVTRESIDNISQFSSCTKSSDSSASWVPGRTHPWPITVDSHLRALDSVAFQICQSSADSLALSVVRVAQQLSMQESVPVVLTGGIMQSPLMRHLLYQRLSSTLPSVRLVQPEITACHGAALIAADLCGRR